MLNCVEVVCTKIVAYYSYIVSVTINADIFVWYMILFVFLLCETDMNDYLKIDMQI